MTHLQQKLFVLFAFIHDADNTNVLNSFHFFGGPFVHTTGYGDGQLSLWLSDRYIEH